MESESDEELNVFSVKFNPLKALYSKEFKIPIENQKRFDNISCFLSRVKSAGGLEADLSKKPSKGRPENNTEHTDEDQKFLVTGRKFTNDQAPIRGFKKSKFHRNLLTKMENCSGPLSLLNKFKQNRTKVMIYTKSQLGARGTITGFIEAFDKHFNIALADCEEIWKRRKFNFTENKVPLLGKAEDCTDLLISMGIKVPEISIKSVDRRNVLVSRSFPQLLLRGEDVILIRSYEDHI